MESLIGKTLSSAEKYLLSNKINYTVKYTGKSCSENNDCDIVLRTVERGDYLELLCGKFILKVNGKGACND